MAEAVCELFPGTKLGIGPPTDDGFYYDFLVPRAVTVEDLQVIEERMRSSIEAGLAFSGREVSREEAKDIEKDQPFKLEIIDELSETETVTFYRHGSFEDLCRGGHTDSTAEIVAFKLLSVAGAYWRGDETRPMLQRIYGTAFESQDDLDAHLIRLEEAQKRDHRRLGLELDLFLMDPIAPASPFFLPKGTVVYQSLVRYVQDLYQRSGYQEVITPQIFDTELWKRSGHYDNYKDNMYFIRHEDREYGLKPMNCPAHALIYSSRLRSYRDLPIRFADFGRLHRYERSGVTHGLTRVRTFSQDDAHIFCTPDQVAGEVRTLINMYQQTYSLFKFKEVRIALSLRPEKRVGSDEIWDTAETALRRVLEEADLPFESVTGEGAFYGPKIDFFVPDALSREWQLGTIQLDFSLPERFDLEYVSDDGLRQRPVVLHKAMIGSLERFMGILIEHFAGAFPVWLAPVQAVIIPIADRHAEYAEHIRRQLSDGGLRVEVNDRNERMNSKIREAQLQKVPYMLIVGDREEEDKTVSVRLRSNEDMGSLAVGQAVEIIREAVSNNS
ncbi:MAG: threonyl-tRNA synthetase [Chloroflexi bacterium]|nr:MAG: threonyl-tRNA synthetase [Chloroflexota bacterium]